MSPTERERILEEASEFAGHHYTKNHFPKHWNDRYQGYISGAIAEHDKARNQAIDEVVKMLTEYVDGEYFEMYWVSLKEKMEALKTIR